MWDAMAETNGLVTPGMGVDESSSDAASIASTPYMTSLMYMKFEADALYNATIPNYYSKSMLACGSSLDAW